VRAQLQRARLLDERRARRPAWCQPRQHSKRNK
jgi:hypothetical protein